MYDYDFKFEQNFYVAITEEAKEKLLNVSLCTSVVNNDLFMYRSKM